MTYQKHAQQLKDRVIELYQTKKNGTAPIYSDIQMIIKAEFGVMISTENIRMICKQWNKMCRKNNVSPAMPEPKLEYKKTVEIHNDGRQTSERLIEMAEEQAKSPEYLLKAHGYDNKLWELCAARNNIWNTYSKQDGIQVLYSSKITVKPRKDSISLDEIKEHFESFRPALPVAPVRRRADGAYMLETPIMDLHLGKMGWAPESGENYDHKIAEARFLYAIQDIINKTAAYPIEKIIFPVGNDFFNFDNISGSTTAGTQQDNDLRWQKVYLKGIELLVRAVGMLRPIAPVELFEVEGNHDRMTCYYAILYIHAYFRNDPGVTVKTDPYPRKYIEYGNSLIGFAHGSEEGRRISGIMQVEAREAWGRTAYHEWHLGHLHSESLLGEKTAGLNIRHISSVCGADAWHARSGYVGSVRKAQAFVWHKEFGLEAIINSVIT
jgi:hypothetical protein